MNKVYQDLLDELNELKDENKVLLSVASSMLATTKERIFQDGLAADGTAIGKYSTKPISISKKRQARNTEKTYFKDGWKAYKQAAGFDASKVTLVDSGQMLSDWKVIPLGNNTIGLGFSNELNSLKADGNEKRFNKQIFAHGEAEDEVFDKVFQVELDRIFGK